MLSFFRIYLEELKKTLLKKYDLRLIISISSQCSDYSDCSRLFDECYALLNYRYIFEYNHIITFEDIAKLNVKIETYPRKTIHEIITCLLYTSRCV